jgi:hypothetical protein
LSFTPPPLLNGNVLFCRFFWHRVWPKLRVLVLSFPDFTDISSVSGITLWLGVKRKAYHVPNEIVRMGASNYFEEFSSKYNNTKMLL